VNIPSSVACQDSVQVLSVVQGDVSQAGAVTTLQSYFTTGDIMLSGEVGDMFRSTQTEEANVAGASTFLPTDRYINMALLYLYRKAAQEAKQFVKPSKLDKIAAEKVLA
jgi:hypothetical protein